MKFIAQACEAFATSCRWITWNLARDPRSRLAALAGLAVPGVIALALTSWPATTFAVIEHALARL